MARILGRFLLILLLVLPSTILLAGNDGSSSIFARAEDEAEGDPIDEEDASVETDDGTDSVQSLQEEGEKEEEEEEQPLKPSPDADTYLLFTKPTTMDFPAGAMVKFLVGFTNNGSSDFIVETMEASFRYPQDYSFYIQNFTTVRYDHVVEPQRQATFEYAFTPSDTFNARPFGLTINLNYKDAAGNIYQDAVYNDTVQITEPDEGLDGETFFLYVFLAAVVVLLLVGAQQLLASFGKKRLTKSRAPVEMGTQNTGDIDYDWIPKETLMNHSPGRSPKQSPRNRRSKRNTGTDD